MSKNLHENIIEPVKRWEPLRLGEVWEQRQLILLLARRDISLRYKQAVFGAAWAIVQPLGMMLVYSLFLGNLVRVPTGEVSYPLFIYSGLLPWQYFASVVSTASTSLVNNQALITKIYFPRLIIPLASIIPAGLDFAISFIILLVMALLSGITLTLTVVWLPVFLLLATATAIGVGLWTSALYVHYRDLSQVVPFILQVWFFASPVVYPANLVPSQWQILYKLNPMAGVIEGFRWALLGTGATPGWPILGATLAAFALLVGGLYFFKHMELRFADVI